ncbi:MAG: peptidase S53 [Terriglobia bacterium]|nr:MAG: peptidase S53 [Terriglobia bacterium]
MRISAVLWLIGLFSAVPGQTAVRQVIHRQMAPGFSEARIVRRMPSDAYLNLAVGLPVRNPELLDRFLEQLSDPSSPNYHRYLTPGEFTDRFGPTPEDYQALTEFLSSNGLTVTATHPNRTIVDVSGSVADIERVFHVRMNHYQHSTRGAFYAPDADPSLDFHLPIAAVSGLDNFVLPRPMSLHAGSLEADSPLVTGSGPGGLFIGGDFRAAYAPDVSLTGAGQTVGLFELDGFYASDVQANFDRAGVSPVPVQTVLLNGFNGAPGNANIEVTLDIMMAAYMAPGLSKIIVYEGTNWNDVLNRMANDNRASQLSCSWVFSPIDSTTEQIFKQMIAQGQSFFQASGDSGGYSGWIMPPADNPNVTVVGGTSLTTAGAGGSWQSETTWHGSGGGVSTTYPIPSYQQGMNLAASGGSMTMRNIPDVALTADVQLFLIQNNGQAVAVGGTSAAAPLWAGFMALANQQAAANGQSRVGFLNPLIYAAGNGSDFAQDLHDISTGNNSRFPAISGYDLATGWGTPAGQSLIDKLVGEAGQPSFTLSDSPGKLSITQGATGKTTVTITPRNGFNGPVSFGVSGLPTGVTAAFSSTNATSGTLTLTVAASAAPGTSNLTITGTSGNLQSTTALSVTILAAPDFTLATSSGSLSIFQSISGKTTLTVSAQNGFSGVVALAASGLPAGVTASFSPAKASTMSIVTFSVASSASPGTSTVTITGTAGSISHAVTISLTVMAPSAGTVLVNAPSAYNVYGTVADGGTFTNGGLDALGRSYSANLMGTSQTVGGVTFYIKPANGPNGFSNKTIPLPSGQYTTVRLLATGVNGNQLTQRFTVAYADGTTAKYTQNLSDWYTPQDYPGESRALTMTYRNNSDGTRDGRSFLLYGYTFNLDSSKTVKSLTLPSNRNVVALAVSLTTGNAPASQILADLSSAFDTTGITGNGKKFQGGLDGFGYAYSGNQLGTAQNFGNTAFTLGPADSPNVVSGGHRTVSLPSGKYSSLALLATGVNGAQASQVFTVAYGDGTSSTFTQSLSDWMTPGNQAGEWVAAVMSRRNTSTGAADNRTFYLFEYSFRLNNSKTISSITLPNNSNVKVLAVTLQP